MKSITKFEEDECVCVRERKQYLTVSGYGWMRNLLLKQVENEDMKSVYR